MDKILITGEIQAYDLDINSQKSGFDIPSTLSICSNSDQNQYVILKFGDQKFAVHGKTLITAIVIAQSGEDNV